MMIVPYCDCFGLFIVFSSFSKGLSMRICVRSKSNQFSTFPKWYQNAFHCLNSLWIILYLIFPFSSWTKRTKRREFDSFPKGKEIQRLKSTKARKVQVWTFPCFPAGEVPPGKSIRHMRQFHSHHNLLSLAQPSSSSTSRLHGQDPDTQDRRGPLGSALSFTLGSGGGSCSSLSGSTESSIWVRQTPQEESKPSPAANFWDFFTGKSSGSETMVWWRMRRGKIRRERVCVCVVLLWEVRNPQKNWFLLHWFKN